MESTERTSYFSYSSLNDYHSCPKQYELKRVRGVTEGPTWWLLGGKAVHEVTEVWDVANRIIGDVDVLFDVPKKFQEIFDRMVGEQSTEHPDLTKWRASGITKANPTGEDYLGWMDVGPKFVQNYITWRREMRQEVWVTPDGEPAIELSIIQELAPGVKVKGFIDRIFVHPNGTDLVVVDLKTSKRVPESDLQLGTYAAAIAKQYGIYPKYGMYYMNRLNKPSSVYELELYTPEYVGQMGAMLGDAVARSIFMPKRSFLCNYCAVAKACYTQSGDTKLTREKDTMNPRFGS